MKITLILFIGCYFDVLQAKSEGDLHKKLFADYNVDVIPRCKANDSLEVKINVALRELYHFYQIEQTVTMKIWVRLHWHDCFLKWNANGYSTGAFITVPHGKIWMPDITLFEDSNDGVDEDMPGKKQYRASISPDGTVQYKFPTVIKSFCSMDVSRFPFDVQNCTLKFGSWVYNRNMLNFVLENDTADLSSLLPNFEWDVSSMKGVASLESYPCCFGKYSEVTYYLVLSRKSKAYVLSLIVPCIFIQILASFGFLLPVESGEKVSLGLTVLLSLVVFQLILAEVLPASAETYPVIGIYFALCVTLCTFSCLLTVIVIVVYHKSTSPMPAWTTRILHRWKVFFGGNARSKGIKAGSNGTGGKLDVNRESVTSDTTLNDWKSLAQVIDRCLFVCYITISAIMSISFIAAIYR